jgi:His-Xaa-Ser system protein HxsD
MEISKEKIMIELDADIYSIDAIKNASYDFTDRAYIFIEKVSINKTRVNLEPKINMEPPERGTLAQDFIQSTLDHQVRLDVARDYKLIREMIIAQAFEPVDNLEEVMESLKS